MTVPKLHSKIRAVAQWWSRTSSLPGISANLKALAEKRLMAKPAEDWDRRLVGATD